MKKKAIALISIMITLFLSGCALGYLPEMPANTASAPAESPVIMEAAGTEDAAALDIPAEMPEPAATAELPEEEETPPAEESGETVPAVTEERELPLEPVVTDTGAVGVLYATEFSYEYGFFSEEKELLRYDFDGDGTEEAVCVGPIDTETDCLRLREGRSAEDTDIFMLTDIAIVRLTEGDIPKLFVCGDYASDDYMTYVFTVGTEKLICEDMIEARLKPEEEKLYFSERYVCLGTRDGVRAYAGDPPVPVSSTLIPSHIPTAEELAEERDMLTEMGILLKSKVDLPAYAEDGTETVLPKGTLMYLVSFTETLERIEVKTEEGALFAMDAKLPNGGWVLTLNGLPEDMCFSNLFYAD